MFNPKELELIDFALETVIQAIASEAVLTAAEAAVLEDLRDLHSTLQRDIVPQETLQ